MNINELINFVIAAKRNTYAAKKNQVESTRSDSVEFRYGDGDYLYIDFYVGSTKFYGQELVYYKGKAVWSMNYEGRVIGDYFSGDFLKEALLNNTKETPYRGPSEFIKDKYKYVCNVDGDFDWFSGFETIEYENNRIYELSFKGGFTK